jgi:hypothetical protein
MMPDPDRSWLADLTNLPDYAVVPDKQTAVLLNVSQDTLDRLDRAGRGPKIVRLSPRRKGRTIGAIKKWLAERREP